MLEAAVTALASLVVLGIGFGLGGYLYHRFYKWMVIHKMEIAFKPGDPVLDLAATTKQMPKTYAADDDEHVSSVGSRDPLFLILVSIPQSKPPLSSLLTYIFVAFQCNFNSSFSQFSFRTFL